MASPRHLAHPWLAHGWLTHVLFRWPPSISGVRPLPRLSALAFSRTRAVPPVASHHACPHKSASGPPAARHRYFRACKEPPGNASRALVISLRTVPIRPPYPHGVCGSDAPCTLLDARMSRAAHISSTHFIAARSNTCSKRPQTTGMKTSHPIDKRARTLCQLTAAAAINLPPSRDR